MRLKDKIAVITGGGSGIGKSAAEMFAAEGAYVCILERDENSGKAVEENIRKNGGKARFLQLDIADRAQVFDVFGMIARESGRIDVLYNNASVFWGTKDTDLEQLDLDIFEQILRINLFGTAYCTKAALPLMKEKGGSIIMTASSCGVIGVPGCESDTSSKGAVISLTRSLAVEYGPYGIRTNCIAPAAIHTPMIYESDLNKATFDEQKFLTSGTPLRRWGTAEDIARIALFLASDDASYMNGAIVVADGGITVS